MKVYELPVTHTELSVDMTHADLLEFVEQGAAKLIPGAVHFPSFIGINQYRDLYMVDVSEMFRKHDNKYVLDSMKNFVASNDIRLSGIVIENPRSLSIIIQDLDSATHYVYPIKVFKNGRRRLGKRTTHTTQETEWKLYSKGDTH